jgi:tripartite-type tricarboxylate transporter receptor subunit TctC
MAPPLIPKEIIEKLNHGLNGVLKDEKFIQFCNDNYVTSGTPMSQKEIHGFIRDSTVKWNSVLKNCKIKLFFT